MKTLSEQEQFIVGTHTAILNIVAMLVDELHRSGILDKSAIGNRINQLLDAMGESPDAAYPFREQAILQQLAAFAKLPDFEGAPKWTPSVIQGGSPEDER